MPGFKEIVDYLSKLTQRKADGGKSDFEIQRKFSSNFAERTYYQAINHNDEEFKLLIAAEELKKLITEYIEAYQAHK